MPDTDDVNDACVVGACGCCYTAMDCTEWEILYRSEEDCLCIRHGCCLSITAEPLGVGLVTKEEEGEICKIGLFCCDLGLIKPSSCCAGAVSMCCVYEVFSFPCSDQYVDECVCACCFLQCCPKFGCCAPPPECPALEKIDKGPKKATMERE